MNHTPLSTKPPGPSRPRHDTTPTISGRVPRPRFLLCDLVASLAQHPLALQHLPNRVDGQSNRAKDKAMGNNPQIKVSNAADAPTALTGANPHHPHPRTPSLHLSVLPRPPCHCRPAHQRGHHGTVRELTTSPISFRSNHTAAGTLFADLDYVSRRRRFGPGGGCAAVAVAAAVPSKY